MSSSLSYGRRRLVALTVAATVAVSLTGIVAAPSVLAVEPGQTTSVRGSVVNTTGAPVVGIEVTYTSVTCDTTHSSISGSESSVATAADGTWSFAAYPGQCYLLDLGEGLFSYQGKTGVMTYVAAGATTVKLITDLATKAVNLALPGVADSTPVTVLAAVDYLGLKLWYPMASSTATSGALAFTAAPGLVYTAVVAHNGDYYDQFLGGTTAAPSSTGGAGTFTVSATAASTKVTGVVKKSGPVRINLTGVDAGATVSVSAIASGGFGGGSLGAVSATTPDATGVTLRGLQPTPSIVTVSGVHGADTVSAEAVGLTPQLTTTTAVSLTGAVRSSALSSSSVYTTVTTDGGTFKVGDTFRAHATLDGAAAPLAAAAGTKISYYWVALDVAGGLGASGRLVGTGPTLPISASLLHTQALGVVAVVTRPGYTMGSGAGVAFYSSALLNLSGTFPFRIGDVQVGDAPSPLTAPSVSGAAVVGGTLTAHPGTWNPRPTSYKYQWSASGKAIAGATKATFAPGASQVGKSIAVTVTPVLSGHTIRAFTSGSTAKVAKATSKITAKAAAKRVKVTSKKVATAKLTVVVAVKGVTPAGKIAVKVDKKTTYVTVAASKKGKVTVKLTKLKRGKHTVTVRYLGSTTVKASAWSSKVVITAK